jgi:hypothetical protein
VSTDWIVLHCPYCGERFEAAVEAGPDEDQVIDCAVCCRPIHLHARDDGYAAQRDDDA